jgi:hypothetical protein
VTVTRRCGSSRHEDAIGHVSVQVHEVVERGAEAVQEGDAAEPRAGGSRHVGSVPVFVSESALVAEIVLLIMGALVPDSRQPHCVHEPVAIT